MIMDYSVTLPLDIPHSEASLASFSTNPSTRSIISWLMTSTGSSSKESRPGLNSRDLFATVEYFWYCQHTHQPCADGLLWRLHPP